MYTILVVIQVLVAVGLIGLVLLQQGKGADAGAAFGSGASGTVFGARGSANFLSRTTAWLAAAFFVVSLMLGYVLHGRVASTSVVERAASAGAPAATPAPTPAPQQGGNTLAVPPEQPAKPAPVKVPE